MNSSSSIFFDQEEEDFDLAVQQSLQLSDDGKVKEHIGYLNILVIKQPNGPFLVIPTRPNGTCGWQTLAAGLRANRLHFYFDLDDLCKDGVQLKRKVRDPDAISNMCEMITCAPVPWNNVLVLIYHYFLMTLDELCLPYTCIIQVMLVIFQYLVSAMRKQELEFIEAFPEKHRKALKAAINLLQMEYPTRKDQLKWAKEANKV